MHALLVRHAAPGLVPGLARRPHQALPPDLRAAAPAGDHLAAGDGRARGIPGGLTV